MQTCKKCRAENPDDAIFCMRCGRKLVNPVIKSRRPNGSGSVCKVSGKRAKPWLARVQTPEKRYCVGYFKTEAEAMKACATFEPPNSPVSREITFREVYDIVITHKENSLSSSSIRVYRFAMNSLQPLWEYPIRSLKAADYQRVIDARRGSFERSSLSKLRQLVSVLCSWAIANELMTVNPARYIELPEQETAEREVFSEEEIRLLFEDGSTDSRYVLAMIYTGMRIGEFFSLRNENVHLGEGEGGQYNYCIGGEKTKAGKNRTIFLHPRIVPFFREWKSEGNEYLITREGRRFTTDKWRDNHYYPLLEKLGIPRKTPHSCRHTFATRVSQAGGNQVALKTQLGHANFSTTANTYIHSDLEALKKLVETID